MSTATRSDFEALSSDQKVAYLMERVQQLEGSAAMAMPATTVAPWDAPQYATPNAFDGTRSRASAFLRQLTLYIQGKPHAFRSDQDRIHFALSYMKDGTAGAWADRIIDQEAAQLLPVFATWAEFVAAFRHTFADIDPGAAARLKMATLAQGTRTADEYIFEFRDLAGRTGHSDVTLMELFENGLHRAIVDKIYALPAMPTALDDWYMYASRFDHQWRKLEAKRKMATAVTPPAKKAAIPVTPTPLTVATPTIAGDTSMDVDRKQRLGDPKRNANIKCYGCGEMGHIRSQCPAEAMKIRQAVADEIGNRLADEFAKLRQELTKPTAQRAAPTAAEPQDFSYDQ